jgi:membrane protease YdiL (CAAX protease family)
MAGTITISAAVRKITGKKIGLPPEDVKELEKMPYWQLVGRGCLLGPMAEEALFRGAPSFLLGAKGVRWGTGLFSSAVFALLHSPELKTLPVPQFLLGAFNWYKMRTRGFGHAFVAHATVNTIVMHTVQLERYTKFRKTKSPVAGEKTQPPKSNVDLMAQ